MCLSVAFRFVEKILIVRKTSRRLLVCTKHATRQSLVESGAMQRNRSNSSRIGALVTAAWVNDKDPNPCFTKAEGFCDVNRNVQPGRPVTLKQIALEAGVSIMTVSRALRNQPSSAVATRRRIQQIADR